MTPWVNAEKAAWALDLALSERYSSSAILAETFSVANASIKICAPRAAPRCHFPVHIMWILVSAKILQPLGGVLPLMLARIWSCFHDSQMLGPFLSPGPTHHVHSSSVSPSCGVVDKPHMLCT